MVPVVLPINYYAGRPEDFSNLTLAVLANGMNDIDDFRFSVSNVENGSNYLLFHSFFVLVVTLTTYRTLYTTYRNFADLAQTYLKDTPTTSHSSLDADRRPRWRLNEAVQLRTVIVQNVPLKLRNEPDLKRWFAQLNIGDVESVVVDSATAGDRAALVRLLARRERSLRKLETAYMQWAANIAAEKKRTRYARRGGGALAWLWKVAGVSGGHDYQGSSGSLEGVLRSGREELTTATIQSLRPKLKSRVSLSVRMSAGRDSTVRDTAAIGGVSQWSPLSSAAVATTPAKGDSLVGSDDAILWYTNKLSVLTAHIKRARRVALASAGENGMIKVDSLQQKRDTASTSATAFVTFKTQRAAQVASQVLLFTCSDPHTMQIRLAPAPQDIIWPAISMNPYRRRLYGILGTLVATALAFFWLVPAQAVARYTNLDNLADIGLIRSGVSAFIAEHQMLYAMLKTIGPPIIISVFNLIIPYMLEGLESHSLVELRTLDHYFFYLIINVLFVFMFVSLMWTYSAVSSIFRDPTSIFSLMAATLPLNATFFINYIILYVMMFPIELCRPVILMLYAVQGWRKRTPREMNEMNIATSYLNFGILYPIHLLVFIIVLCYSVLAPLILIPGTIYFGVGYLVFKNQLLYVYVKEWESYGRHWVMSFKRMIVGLLIFQVTMAGLLLAKQAPLAACMPIILIPATIVFYLYCQDSFDRRTRQVPLDQFLSASPTSSSHPLPAGSSAVLADASLEADVVLTAEEHQMERYSVSYLNPALSRPLSRPWLPISVAGWWALLPRYSSDGHIAGPDDDADDDALVSMEDGADAAGGSTSAFPSIVVATLEVDKEPEAATTVVAGTLTKGVLIVGTREEAERHGGELDIAVTPKGVLSVWSDLEGEIKHAQDSEAGK
ncbi:hypothetical protein HK101_003887 [Irineochytrium annulatum]|nr:hypothetical protein HK101_003887 [Irineochytrium annulatum]